MVAPLKRASHGQGENMAYEDARNDSLTHTIGRIIDDLRDLFREEIALAKAELRHEAGEVGNAAMRMGVAAGAGLFAAAFLLLGLAQGFAALVGWPAWGGYLAMGVVLGIAAVVALQAGRARAKKLAGMPKTVESLKETKEWMNDRMSSKTR
jgi:hypothetical protein